MNNTAIFQDVFDRVRDVLEKPNVPVSNREAAQVAHEVTKELAPVVENATNSESWWRSRVILGALVAIIAGLFGTVGIVIDEETRGQLVTLIPVLVSTAGAVFALYGRIVGATKKPLGVK
ncbi:MAG TPA: hypothetical protein VD863_06920 [Bradyrhizobium sp.]|nr:hypothetical protein [Bradyrhizobium sp.]